MPADPPKRRFTRAQRRVIIEDAAAKLFAARGYSDTRTADIAAAAGISRQLLMQHFATKRELFRALLLRHRDELFGRLQHGMDRDDNLSTRITDSVRAWFAYLETEPFAARMLFYDSTGIAEITALHEQMRAQAHALIAELLRGETELAIDDEEIDIVAEWVRAATTGVAMWRMTNPDIASEVVTETAARLICRALGIGMPRPKRKAASRGRPA